MRFYPIACTLGTNRATVRERTRTAPSRFKKKGKEESNNIKFSRFIYFIFLYFGSDLINSTRRGEKMEDKEKKKKSFGQCTRIYSEIRELVRYF